MNEEAERWIARAVTKGHDPELIRAAMRWVYDDAAKVCCALNTFDETFDEEDPGWSFAKAIESRAK